MTQHKILRTVITAVARMASMAWMAVLLAAVAAEAGTSQPIDVTNWYWGPGNHWS